MSPLPPSHLATCELLRTALPLFVGDDLGRDAAGLERARLVREHLMQCPSCRRQASALQQARKALQQFGHATPSGVDEEFFAQMHTQVLAGTVHAPIDAAWRGGAWGDRLRAGKALLKFAAMSCAAGLLFALGFWFVDLQRGDSVLHRPPLVLDASVDEGGGRAGLARAVPYAGGRVELKLLGYEDGGAVGQGMAGRLELRLLGDEARLPARRTAGDPTAGDPTAGDPAGGSPERR